MNDLLSVLLSTLKARITPIWTKLKYWTSWNFIKTKILTKIRNFLTTIFQVKPKDKDDYYPIFGWLISKKLARAIVIVVGILCVCYFVWINPIGNITEGMGSKERIYNYNSLPLRFEKGAVKIKAKSGYIAYEGNVEKGYATGQGCLYDENGQTVYKGNFEKNEYSGQGTLYYPIGQVKYAGTFLENQFEGTGTLYRENGTKQYTGLFADGVYEGEGTLYNASEVPAFTGNFHNGELVYTQLLGKTPSEIAEYYTGNVMLYQNDTESAVIMEDIDAFYVTPVESTGMAAEVKASTIYVGKNEFVYGEQRMTSIEEICKVLGEPIFEGNSYITFAESVGTNWLLKKGKDIPMEIEIEAQQMFDDVWTVESYPVDTMVYLYVFLADDITYTFIAPDRNSEFFMYALEQ